MYCHQCRHSKKVAAGFYKNTPFGRTPCAHCPPEQNPSHPTVYLDEMGGPLGDLPKQAVPWEQVEIDGEVMPVRVLTDFVAGVMRLKPKIRDTVCLRYAGYSQTQIGRKLRIPISTVSMRLSRAVETWPALRELLPAEYGIRKESGRNRGENAVSADHAKSDSIGKDQ